MSEYRLTTPPRPDDTDPRLTLAGFVLMALGMAVTLAWLGGLLALLVRVMGGG